MPDTNLTRGPDTTLQSLYEHLASELRAGRLLGPLSPHLAPLVHTSPLGLVPRSNQPGRFRLIVDLSRPVHSSVNGGIPDDLCSVKYSSVDDAVAIIRSLGHDTELAKLDLKDAYRIIPVHPRDYYLLGISWQGRVYLDRALPFGFCSAPKVFTAVADVIAWVLHHLGVVHQLHYLDDYHFLGPPHSGWELSTATGALQLLWIPVALDKMEGPSMVLEFLIDTHTFQLRPPLQKLSHLQSMAGEWVNKHYCQRNDLESLLGHLSHAATVVQQGHTFLRELFTLLARPRGAYHFIHMGAKARALMYVHCTVYSSSLAWPHFWIALDMKSSRRVRPSTVAIQPSW